MAEGLNSLEIQNTTVTSSNSITSFTLKARHARYGVKRRQEQLEKVQKLCQNEPIVETEDWMINQTQYEKYMDGEIIQVMTETKQRQCITVESCSKEGPGACGYGWINPDPLAPVDHFSFHQVSDGSICVKCYIDLPGGAECPSDGFCLCEDIQNKEDLMDCSNYF